MVWGSKIEIEKKNSSMGKVKKGISIFAKVAAVVAVAVVGLLEWEMEKNYFSCVEHSKCSNSFPLFVKCHKFSALFSAFCLADEFPSCV